MSPLPDNATIRLTCDRLPSQGRLAIGGAIVEGLVFTGVSVSGVAIAATATLNLETPSATGVARMTANPSDGATVVVAGTTYTFKNTLASSNQIKIGADVVTTLTNLMSAINDSGGEGTAYGTGTVENGNVIAQLSGADRIVITALSPGTAGTVFTLGQSGTTNLTWNTVNLALSYNPVVGDTVTIGAKTYTFKSALTTANDVLIGPTPLDSAKNLDRACNDSGVEGTNYGTGTTANADATAAALAMNAAVVFTAVVSGTPGNALASTHTLPVGGFAALTFGGGYGASRLGLSDMKDGDFVIAQFAIAMISVLNPGGTVDYGRTQGYVRRGDYWDGTSFMLFTAPTGGGALWYARDDIIDEDIYPPNIANLIGYDFSYREAPVINVYSSTHLTDTTVRARARLLDEPDLLPATKMEAANRFAARMVDDPSLVSASASSLVTGVSRWTLAFNDPPLVTQYQECTGTMSFWVRMVEPFALQGGVLRLEQSGIERIRWQHYGVEDLAPDFMGTCSWKGRMIEPPDLLGNEFLQVFARASWRHSGEILIEGIGMTLDGVILDCIQHWGFTSLEKFARPKFEYLQNRIINDLNAVLQIIYSKAKLLNYFNRETRSYTCLQDATAVTLPFDVQEVLGYVRRADGVSLIRVETLPEIEGFSGMYSPGGTTGLPIAYHVQRNTQQVFDWDATRITLRVAPAPDEAVPLSMEVAVQAPRYDWAAVMTRTPLTLPHTYCESLLLPLLRQRCLTAEFADGVDAARRQQIADEYQRAAVTLELVDPAPRTLETPKREEALAS